MRNHRLRNSVIRHVFRVAIVGILAITEHVARADEPFFVGTGITGSTLASMTSDGRYVVGGKWREGDGLNNDNFDIVRWERGGPQLVIDVPGLPVAISEDASVIVGASGKFLASRVFRWTAAGVEFIAPRLDAWPTLVSGDFNTIILSRKDVAAAPYVWTASEGLGRLQFPDGEDNLGLFGLSHDGSTMVGGNSSHELYRWSRDTNTWTSEPGFQGLFTPPPGFPNVRLGPFSRDMLVAGGSVGEGAAKQVPARWTEATGWVALSGLGGQQHDDSITTGISADGSILVGRAMAPSGPEPFIWDELNGTRNLTTLLRDNYDLGAELAGWDLTQATGISADGRTVLGHGLNPAGVREFWVAYLPPAPGDFDGNGQLDVTDIDALTGHIQSGGTAASFDLNADNIVNLGDLKVWVEDLKQTFFGDANLDGVFSSRDLVGVFQFGHYEDAIEDNSTWASGDWNADQDFTSSDLVMAFQDGGYEKGERVIVAVPEPANVGWILAWMTTVTRRRLRR